MARGRGPVALWVCRQASRTGTPHSPPHSQALLSGRALQGGPGDTETDCWPASGRGGAGATWACEGRGSPVPLWVQSPHGHPESKEGAGGGKEPTWPAPHRAPAPHVHTHLGAWASRDTRKTLRQERAPRSHRVTASRQDLRQVLELPCTLTWPGGPTCPRGPGRPWDPGLP